MSDLFKLKNGTILISTEAPGGIYNSAQLKKIAELCSKELAIVKATEDQRLALFVKESEIDRITSELKATGLGFRNYQSGLHQPVSCLGELCETHEQPALTTAMDLTKLIADLKLQTSVKIGINGCARCCTPCHTLDISVIGEASGYRISMGGKTSQFPELASFFAESVPPEKLPLLLTNVIKIFQAKAEEGESFNEVLDRCGVEDFVAALAPYSQDAAHRDDPFAVSDEAEGSSVSVDGVSNDDVSMDDETIEGAAGDGLSIDGETIDAEPEMLEIDAEAAAEHDEINYDINNEAGGDDLMGEITIGSQDDQALSDEIKVSDDGLSAAEELSLGSVDAEPELMQEIVEEPEMVLDDAELVLDEPEMMRNEDEAPHIEQAAEADDFESEAKMVSAALESESEIEISEDSEDEMEELEFEDSAMMSEELMIHEPELLDAEEGLEADVPLLSTEEVSDIPELDEDLLQSNEIDSSALLLEDEEGEEGDMMSIEDEQRFEQKIQASIEEEKKMRDGVEEDANQGARADALRMLETATEPDDEPTVDDDLATPAAPVASHPSKASPVGKSFDFDGFDVTENTMRVYFSSGAYLDVQLDSLEMSRSKLFRMGRQAITVTHEADGYTLEVDGMRMFYPHQNMRVAS